MWCKVTIIWTPQSGTSAEGCKRHICEPSGVQFGGPGEHRELRQWGPGQSPGRQQFFCILYTKKSLKKQVSISICTAKHTLSVLGQIRDTKPKTGQMGILGELWLFFWDTSLKMWDCHQRDSGSQRYCTKVWNSNSTIVNWIHNYNLSNDKQMFLFTFRKHQVVTVKLVVLTKPSEIKREEKTEEMGENRKRLW